MAHIKMVEMNKIITDIVKAVRIKAKELEIQEGIVAICCNAGQNLMYEKSSNDYFADFLVGEDLVRFFSLKGTDFSFIESLKSGVENFEYFGDVVKKIAVAAEVYFVSGGQELISRNVCSPVNYGGCVTYPLIANYKPCGEIYVAVIGGSERQNEVCAWEAYIPISTGLSACRTTNPGPAKYGIPEL